MSRLCRLRRVPTVFVASLAITGALCGAANAQEIIPVDDDILITEPVVIDAQMPPVTADLTGEGELIGMPTGPIVIGPAPSTSAPQPEVPAPPPSTLIASDIPERANIWDDIFNIADCADESNPLCFLNP